MGGRIQRALKKSEAGTRTMRAMAEEKVPAPDPSGPKRKPPKEAVAEAQVRAPTRGNRKLESFLEAVNSDEQVRAW
jgi:hypothetical protein